MRAEGSVDASVSVGAGAGVCMFAKGAPRRGEASRCARGYDASVRAA